MQYVLNVDRMDQPIELIEKNYAHINGLLHRAFSIFVFRHGVQGLELLIQKRAASKYHSGGLWTNTCCSHAMPDIDILVQAETRLKEEMGFTCHLESLGLYYYKAEVGNGMIEHEMDHVFMSYYDVKDIHVNPSEVSHYKWIDINELLTILEEKPCEFTAWFKPVLEYVLHSLDEKSNLAKVIK